MMIGVLLMMVSSIITNDDDDLHSFALYLDLLLQLLLTFQALLLVHLNVALSS